MTSAAFLDRDGTINVKVPEGEYVTRPAQLELLPGADDAIRRLNDAGIMVVIVTNQRGIALGRMSEEDLQAVHDRLADELRRRADARIDLFVHCPHDRDECRCRKPETGMLETVQRRFPAIERSRSFLIGDAPSDAEAGRRFGLRTWQIGVDVPDLGAGVDLAVDWVRESRRGCGSGRSDAVVGPRATVSRCSGLLPFPDGPQVKSR